MYIITNNLHHFVFNTSNLDDNDSELNDIIQLNLSDVLIPNDMAASTPASSRRSDHLTMKFLAPSSMRFSPKYGETNVSINYTLRVSISLTDSVNKSALELVSKLPLIVSSYEQNCDSIDESQVNISGDFYQELSPDAFLPKLNEVFADVQQSIYCLQDLRSSWDARNLAISEMVTEPRDHSAILYTILDSLTQQIAVFINLLQQPSIETIVWPNETIPFNMFILELELLCKCVLCGQSNEESIAKADMLMSNCRLFYGAVLSIIKKWMGRCADCEGCSQIAETSAGLLRGVLESFTQ